MSHVTPTLHPIWFPCHDARADMLADPAKILEIETGSMGHDVLESFTSAVDFEVSRASEMHAFGSWFDVAFALPGAPGN